MTYVAHILPQSTYVLPIVILYMCYVSTSHIYIYVYIHVIDIYIHIYIYIHMCTYIYTHTYIYIHTHTYIYICAHIHIYIYVHCEWVAIGSKSITSPIPVGQNAFPQTKRPRSLKEVQAENTKAAMGVHTQIERAPRSGRYGTSNVPPTTTPMRALSLDCFRK